MATRGGAGERGGGKEPAARSAASPAGRGAARKGFPLRLPPKMLTELRAWANQDLRSLNAQIEFLLADALRRRRGSGGPPAPGA